MWCSLSSWTGDTESFGDSGYLTCFASSGSTWHYSLRVLDVHPMSGDVRQLGVELRFGLELPPPSWILTLLLLFRATTRFSRLRTKARLRAWIYYMFYLVGKTM